MRKRVVNILGTKYNIEWVDRKTYKYTCGNNLLKDNEADAVTLNNKPLIIIADDLSDYDEKHVLRHEIVHAFKHESGIVNYQFTQEEQQVDWIARQLTKIYEVYKKLGVE